MPRGADNATLVLDAARELFLGRGYVETSMDAVAVAAGVSKATVYAHFGSKDELFIAMVIREGRDHTDFLTSTTSSSAADVLHDFGRHAANLLLSDHVVAFHRIVAGEASRSPEVGRLYWMNGPERLLASLATFLAAAMERGELRVAPARMAAAQFLAIIVGDLQLRAFVGNAHDVSAADRAIVVDAGVDTFLRAFSP